MPTQTPNAVVIGAGIAGLAAARVLSDRFDRVTLVDRDTLPDQPRSRRGSRRGRTPTRCSRWAATRWRNCSRG